MQILSIFKVSKQINTFSKMCNLYKKSKLKTLLVSNLGALT